MAQLLMAMIRSYVLLKTGQISQKMLAHVKSKTIAEKAAWDFVKNNKANSFSITTIHPGMVFGPLLTDDIDGAQQDFSKMINGKIAGPNAYLL